AQRTGAATARVLLPALDEPQLTRSRSGAREPAVDRRDGPALAEDAGDRAMGGRAGRDDARRPQMDLRRSEEAPRALDVGRILRARDRRRALRRADAGVLPGPLLGRRRSARQRELIDLRRVLVEQLALHARREA